MIAAQLLTGPRAIPTIVMCVLPLVIFLDPIFVSPHAGRTDARHPRMPSRATAQDLWLPAQAQWGRW